MTAVKSEAKDEGVAIKAKKDHSAIEDESKSKGPGEEKEKGKRKGERADSHGRSKRARSRSRSRREGNKRSRRSPSPNGRGRANRDGDDGRAQRRRRSSRSPSRSRSRSRSAAEEVADDSTKDQRTIFVSQLVMKANERDLRRYFRREAGKVNDVVLLRDKRSGRHKGCAYIELARFADVSRALKLGGKVPDFQRFPVLVKSSEAEKNYPAAGVAASMQDALGGVVTGGVRVGAVASSPSSAALPAVISSDGRRVEARKVYVGSIERAISSAQLQYIFQVFGQLDSVMLQVDPATNLSRGFAFLGYRDPKDAHLAIQVMSGQSLSGRAL